MPSVEACSFGAALLGVPGETFLGSVEHLQGDDHWLHVPFTDVGADVHGQLLHVVKQASVFEHVIIVQHFHQTLHEDGGVLFHLDLAARPHLEPASDPVIGVFVVEQCVQLRLDHVGVDAGALDLGSKRVCSEVKLLQEALDLYLLCLDQACRALDRQHKVLHRVQHRRHVLPPQDYQGHGILVVLQQELPARPGSQVIGEIHLLVVGLVGEHHRDAPPHQVLLVLHGNPANVLSP
mmetsp:Transcript_53420/g.96201  ORF Transcript_53420/g.96201 Transcript_53420/m.96201 type:complete len:236 (-) Transcript_53420:307-1014(-)